MQSEPAPFSILYDGLGAGSEVEDREAPDFFSALNLDQVFDAVAATRREYNLAAFFRSPLPTEGEVVYRQDVFRDLEAVLAQPVAAFGEQMRRTRSHLTGSRQSHSRYTAAAWFLDAGEIYCAAVTALESAVANSRPASIGFQRCSAYLTGYVHSPEFQQLNDETAQIKRGLGQLRYSVRVQGSRVVVTDYRDEPDYSLDVLATFEKFRQRDAEGRLVKSKPTQRSRPPVPGCD